MSSNKNKGARTKSRPSSSAQAANLLGGTGRPAFIGFGSQSSGIASAASIVDDSNADPDLQFAFKKLTKKDSTTKLKAIAELGNLLKEKPVDIVELYLPSWTKAYSRLSLDYDWKVRAAINGVFMTIVDIVKKKLALQLKSLIGYWLCNQFDPSKEVSTASQAVFKKTFPEAKQTDVLQYTKKELIVFLKDNLVQTVQTLNNLKEVTPTEANEKYERVISSSILALAFLIKSLPAKDNEELKEDYVSILDQKFWKGMMNSNSEVIRRSTYSLIASLCSHSPSLLEGHVTALSPMVLGALNEKKPVNHAAMWEAMISFVRVYPDSWKHANMQKAVFPRFWAFLRAGCFGSTNVSYPSLLPFVSLIPKPTEWFVEFFNSLWQGKEVEKLDRQATPIESILSSYIECFMYFLFAFTRSSDDETRSKIPVLEDLFYSQVMDLLLCDESPICPIHILVSKIGGAIAKIATKLPTLRAEDGDLEQFLNGILMKAKGPLTSDLEALRSSGDETKSLFSYETFTNRLAQLLAEVKNQLNETQTEDNKKSESFGSLLKLVKELTRLALPKAREGGSHQINFISKLSETFGVAIFPPQEEGVYNSVLVPWIKDQLSKNVSSFQASQLFVILRSYFQTIPQDTLKFEWRNVVSLVAAVPYAPSRDYLLTLLEKVCDGSDNMTWRSDELDSVADAAATRLLSGAQDDRSAALSDRKLLSYMIAGKADQQNVTSLVSHEVIVKIVDLCNKSLQAIKSTSSTSSIRHISDLFEILDKIFGSSQLTAFNNEVVSLVFTKILEVSLNLSVSRSPYDAELFPSDKSLRMPKLWQRQSRKLNELENAKELTRALSLQVKEKLLDEKYAFDEEVFVQYASSLLDIDANSLDNILFDSTDNASWSCWRSWVNFPKTTNFLTLDLPVWLSTQSKDSSSQGQKTQPIEIYGRMLKFAFGLSSKRGWEVALKKSGSSSFEWNVVSELVCGCILAREVDYKLDEANISKSKSWDSFKENQATHQSSLFSYLRDLFQSNEDKAKEFVNFVFNVLVAAPSSSLLERVLVLKETIFTLLNPSRASQIVVPVLTQKKLDEYTTSDALTHIVQSCVGSLISVSDDRPAGDLMSWFSSALESFANQQTESSVVKRSAELLSAYFRSFNSTAVSRDLQSLKLSPVRDNIPEATSVAKLFYYMTPYLSSTELRSSKFVTFMSETLLGWIKNKSASYETLSIKYYTLRLFRRLSNILDKQGDDESTRLSEEASSEWNKFKFQMFSIFLDEFFEEDRWGGCPASRMYYDEFAACLTTIVATTATTDSPASKQIITTAESLLESERKITQLFDLLLASSLINQQKAAYTLLFSIIKKRNQNLLDNSKSLAEGEESHETLISSQLRNIFENHELSKATLAYPEKMFGYFLVWALVIEYLTVKVSQVRGEFIDYLKHSKITAQILQFFFTFIDVNKEIEFEEMPLQNIVSLSEIDHSTPSLAKFAAVLYLKTLRLLPVVVRSWWSGLTDRHLSIQVDNFTTANVSPLIIKQEIDTIAKRPKGKFDEYTMKASHSAGVSATYVKDDLSITMSINIPPSYPLRLVEVQCDQKIGVSEAQLRKWLLSITTLLMSKDGSILDGLLLWKESLDKHFEGVEPCPICYSVFHLSNNSLPKLQCKTCKNKFHSACMYKWINTSQGKNSCPMCRTPFNIN